MRYSDNDLAEGKHILAAFSGTRVLNHDADFVESVVRRSRQIAREHLVLTLGHQGVGKSELCNALRKWEAPLAVSGAVSATTKRACSYDFPLSAYGNGTNLSVDLVDTIGWSSKQPSRPWACKRPKDSWEDYQDALEQRGLDDRHLPHIVLFVMSAKTMREIKADAAKMREAFKGFNERTSLPVTVIPVLTHRDCCQQADYSGILSAARDVATIAFKDSKAKVRDPVRFVASVTSPAQVEENASALHSLGKDIYDVVQKQVKDSNFRELFLKAMAEDMIVECKSFYNAYPDVESEWALFKAVANAVAVSYGKRMCGNGLVNSKVCPPWDLLKEFSVNSARSSGSQHGARPSGSQHVGIMCTRLWTALRMCWLLVVVVAVYSEHRTSNLRT